MTELVMFERLRLIMNMNSYESLIWRALLSRGVASAAELSEISHVPRSRCYDVLESLEKKGFVFQKIGKPIRYIANEPEEAIRILQKQVKMEQARMFSHYDDVQKSEIFAQLASLYHTGISYVDNLEISASITGRSNILRHIKEMIEKSVGKVTISSSADGLKNKMKLLRKVKKKVPIEIRSSAKLPAPSNISFIAGNSSCSYVHTDDEILFFTTPDNSSPELENAIWIKSSYVTQMFLDLIN